ncbi:MAG: hypothetical protein EON89_10515 [Brevundimonas sp.]|nr:MAG: hypothetical protein EON89_10515 [Brevundimonas sp.]
MSAFLNGSGLTTRGLAHERDLLIGGLTFRPSLCQTEINGETQHLEPRVARVLLALGRSAGTVLSRDDLLACCWDGVVVGDDAINRVIGKIRRLAERPRADFLIETVPRVGYRIVSRTDAPAKATLNRTADDFDVAAGRPSSLSVGDVVAVLPFDGEGGPEAASLAEGATDCILSTLTRDGEAAVVGRTHSCRFRGALKGDAARALGATRIVDGAVSIHDDELRITTYLIEGASSLTLWSEQFNGSVADPFALQRITAMRVTEALRSTQAMDRPSGTAPGAYRIAAASSNARRGERGNRFSSVP